jgi:hypothetical protein
MLIATRAAAVTDRLMDMDMDMVMGMGRVSDLGPQVS